MAERARRRPRAQTRADLLDAAARVFARRGFHAASVDEVSEEAGFSTGAVYSNFAGKDDLFLALYEERVGRRRRELRAAVEQAGGGAAGLAAAGASVAEAFDAERDWFLLYFEFALHAARDPAFAERFRSQRDEGLSELSAGLDDGLAHAGARGEGTELARAVRALTYGLALEGLVEKSEDLDAVFARTLALIFRGLSAE